MIYKNIDKKQFDQHIYFYTTIGNSKRKGCRCGNATAMPGKLTCCGQRCPCYVDAKACFECKVSHLLFKPYWYWLDLKSW